MATKMSFILSFSRKKQLHFILKSAIMLIVVFVCKNKDGGFLKWLLR